MPLTVVVASVLASKTWKRRMLCAGKLKHTGDEQIGLEDSGVKREPRLTREGIAGDRPEREESASCSEVVKLPRTVICVSPKMLSRLVLVKSPIVVKSRSPKMSARSS